MKGLFVKLNNHLEWNFTNPIILNIVDCSLSAEDIKDLLWLYIKYRLGSSVKLQLWV